MTLISRMIERKSRERRAAEKIQTRNLPSRPPDPSKKASAIRKICPETGGILEVVRYTKTVIRDSRPRELHFSGFIRKVLTKALFAPPYKTWDHEKIVKIDCSRYQEHH